MSERNPDDIEFDFFDEPDEETVTQRRRAVRPPRPQNRGPRPPRGPIAGPGGLTPLLRLVGLIAFAILAWSVRYVAALYAGSAALDPRRERIHA
jgi:hypothetical protein